jgi:hypothetical protein
VDRAVVETLLDGGPNEPVLVDPRQTLELGRGNDRSQVVAPALVEYLDFSAGERHFDHAPDLVEIRHTQTRYCVSTAAPRATSIISSTLQNLIRGRP